MSLVQQHASTSENAFASWLKHKWQSAWFPTFTAVNRWWRDRFTTGGKLAVALLIVCAPGVWSMHFGHIYLFVALATTLLLCWAINLLFTPRLSVHAIPPVSVEPDRPFELPLRLENLGKLPAFDLQTTLDRLPPGWELLSGSHAISGMAAGQALTFAPILTTRRRGRFKLPRLRATHFFPVCLLRRRWQIPVPGHLIVLPRYNRIELPVASAAGQCEGYAPSLQSGASCEVSGIREYQPGVAVRRWDYASWARLGYPIVREFEDSQQQLATVVLDNYATPEEMQKDDFDVAFEASVSRTASVAAALTSAGISIDSLWIGSQQYQVQVTPDEDGFIKVMNLLALAKPQLHKPHSYGEPFWQPGHRTTSYLIVRNDCQRKIPDAGSHSAPIVTVQVLAEDFALHEQQEESA